jgi:hypothetical protein
MTSILTKDQKIQVRKVVLDNDIHCREVGFTVTIRYDDQCGNGHNTFSITANTFRMGGCLHDLIAKHFPEFAHLIKWHLVSSDGPLHYVANTTYWAKQRNLENARSCAVWEDASLEDLMDAEKLKARLPSLMEKFKADIEALGFIY